MNDVVVNACEVDHRIQCDHCGRPITGTPIADHDFYENGRYCSLQCLNSDIDAEADHEYERGYYARTL